MKHMLRAVLILLMTAGVASAFAIADNDQFEFQGDGGFAGVAPGFASGQIAGAWGVQGQEGMGLATPGDIAFDSQTNQQIQSDFVMADDGAGTFAGSAWTADQNQFAGGITAGGFYGYEQTQGQVGGSAGVTVGGQFGVAGSAYVGASQGAVGAVGATVAGAGQYQTYQGQYIQQSVSPNGGFINQSGEQYAGTGTFVGAAIIGGASAGAMAVQGGGTLAVNNGQGTAMAGSGTAAGYAAAGTSAQGIAIAGAGAFAGQQHNYEQFNTSADGTSQQYQTGTVGTFVSVGSVDTGP